MRQFTPPPVGLISDCADVLCTGPNGLEHRLAPILGIHSQIIRDQFHGDELFEFFRGKIEEDEYWQKIINRYSWKCDIALPKAKVRENFELIDGVLDIMHAVKNQGLMTAILSVHTKPWSQYVDEKFHITKPFDLVHWSWQRGLLKPEPRAFTQTLELMGLPARKVVFVDDMNMNIEAARELGLDTILFTSVKQLRLDLSARGINSELKAKSAALV